MEPSAAQKDDEEEVMDGVANDMEVELKKLEVFELDLQQGEDQQSKREETGRHHPSTPGEKSTGEETREEEIGDEYILKVVQDQTTNQHQVTTSTTLSTECGIEDELAFPQPRLTCGQNLPDMATMYPGAYAVAPGTDIQRITTLSRSILGPTASSDELSVADSSDEGLAVANKVEETEEPTQFARPNNTHRKNGSTSMNLMILVLIGGLPMVGVIVGSICGAGLCSNKEGDVETQAPTSFRYFVLEDFQNRIEEAFGPDYFYNNDEPEPNQPKIKALDWIVFEDPLQLNPDASNLLQRFILSLTYFQTSRKSDWLTCSPSTTANDETCWIQILDWESLASRWLMGAHECHWAGISCDGEKNITQLQFRDNGLNGPLPTELASLPALEKIDFYGNQLTGLVPSMYGSFLSLSSLNLANSQLSGSIPFELFRNELSLLSLGNNSLTGTVPTEVGRFDGIALHFGSNSLSGSIPTELFQTGKGSDLRIFLHDNKLTGTLPTEIGALHGHNQLLVYLQGNPLHGTIPSEIGLLKGSLGELDISWTNMDGALPEELFTECTNLFLLRASNCGLTGTISTGLQRWTRLNTFDISNNKFHGTIPSQLSALTSLGRQAQSRLLLLYSVL
ncbi:LRR receptor-like serine threonine-protein kinase [Seminavis robusta]|uniref:LRR receptor-like serine threonine-protein kinase n=1 Tax=Seminavis robusta TaxID=568900 RepID=A0A9N8HYG5_9STRA|nr:LRR receptor-like serine threonine-protein kinase [Seminavis robusta]|eukprot:Sro1991_g309810.1 LRR receptor-like serine threonine-protein kinase (622) ;mRNA; f:13313-15460